MIADEKFKYEQKPQGNKKIVQMQGTIDEDANFDAIGKIAGPLVLNFKSLAAINSCGVRNWVNFLKTIPKTEIFFEECPPLIVRQMNMVPSFVGHAKVLSVYVPYVCDACDTEKLVLVEAGKFNEGNPEIPETMTCDSCKKGEMELDGHPQQYFAFSK